MLLPLFLFSRKSSLSIARYVNVHGSINFSLDGADGVNDRPACSYYRCNLRHDGVATRRPQTAFWRIVSMHAVVDISLVWTIHKELINWAMCISRPSSFFHSNLKMTSRRRRSFYRSFNFLTRRLGWSTSADRLLAAFELKRLYSSCAKSQHSRNALVCT